jgi:hypothetical protein
LKKYGQKSRMLFENMDKKRIRARKIINRGAGNSVPYHGSRESNAGSSIPITGSMLVIGGIVDLG